MSKRKAGALIALVWAVAAILCVLPSISPWYMHLIGTRTYQWYEAVTVGFCLGYVTRHVTAGRL